MTRRILCTATLGLLAGLLLTGCPGSTTSKKPGTTASRGSTPTFSLAWSEYPSWSVFGVAHEEKLINGDKGQLGPIEEKWGVDIELKQADYEPCMTMYGSGTCDAVCITNMDVLNPALSRKSVAVLPTSTSVGGDALIVVGINDVKDLRNQKVYGLAKSVSEYCFVRNLEKLKEKEADHKFTNMDPAAAAQAMQTKQKGYHAIMVWNPFVLQTLQTRKDARVLFDSSTIPGEIIDMVVVAKESLDKPGGREFACAVIDTYYALNRKLADPKTGNDTLVALGAKFSNLKLDAMKKVVEQTRFYKTADEGLGILTGAELPKTMEMVTDFCVKHDIVKSKPTIAYGSDKGGAQLLFDPSYIQEVMKKKE
jgi:NitT/TauT family transport system substrate-binding protein